MIETYLSRIVTDNCSMPNLDDLCIVRHNYEEEQLNKRSWHPVQFSQNKNLSDVNYKVVQLVKGVTKYFSAFKMEKLFFL